MVKWFIKKFHIPKPIEWFLYKHAPTEKSFRKDFSRTVSLRQRLNVVKFFYRKCVCNFSSTRNVLKSITGVWVNFDATMLEKVRVLVSTIVIDCSLRDTRSAFTNIIICEIALWNCPAFSLEVRGKFTTSISKF